MTIETRSQDGHEANWGWVAQFGLEGFVMRGWVRGLGFGALAAVYGVGVCLAQLGGDAAGARVVRPVGAVRVAAVSLRESGWMTQSELSRQSTITEEGKYKGYIRTGPEGGVTWSGVGEVVAEDGGRVLVGLPIWASGVAPRSPVRGEGDKLRVVVVDAAKGAVEATWDFPTQSLWRLSLGLASDGVPLVFAGDKLMRVGADGKPTAELAVRNVEKEYEAWDVASSVSGRKVRLRLNGDFRMMVDAGTLAVLGVCHEDTDNPTPVYKQGADTFSQNTTNDGGTFTDDEEFMTNSEGDFPKFVERLDREKFCRKRERIEGFGTIDFAPTIVDDARLIAMRKDRIALRTIGGEAGNGKTLWTHVAPAGRMFEAWEGAAVVSRNGERMAVRLLKTEVYQEPTKLEVGRRRSPLVEVQLRSRERPRTKEVDVEAGIEVLDVATGRVLAEVPIDEKNPDLEFKAKARFSLSPDGKRLAILQDGQVVVWAL